MALIAIASLLFINISFAANTGKVMVETAKLREQANTDSKVLELASQGEEVEILKKSVGAIRAEISSLYQFIRDQSNAKNQSIAILCQVLKVSQALLVERCLPTVRTESGMCDNPLHK